MKVVKTEKAPLPGGWYSQAYEVDGIIYTAGVTGNLPETGELISTDMKEQTRQALRNIEKILEAAGSDLGKVFKTLCFVDDIELFSEFNEAYREFFPENPPARSTVQVGKFSGGVHVEIEVIAKK